MRREHGGGVGDDPGVRRVLLASGEVTEADAGEAKVPADTTVWFTTA